MNPSASSRRNGFEVMSPTMVGTDHLAFGVTLAGHDAVGSMLADIVEGTKPSLLRSNNEDGVTRLLRAQVVAGLRHLGTMANELPGLGEDFLLFLGEEVTECSARRCSGINGKSMRRFLGLSGRNG